MISEDTLPKLLLRNYNQWGDSRIAMRRKDFGIWEVFTWKDVYEKVKYFALAMISNGFEPGDKIHVCAKCTSYTKCYVFFGESEC